LHYSKINKFYVRQNKSLFVVTLLAKFFIWNKKMFTRENPHFVHVMSPEKIWCEFKREFGVNFPLSGIEQSLLEISHFLTHTKMELPSFSIYSYMYARLYVCSWRQKMSPSLRLFSRACDQKQRFVLPNSCILRK